MDVPIELEGFTDLKVLHREARRDVLRATRRSDSLPVVLKVFHGGGPSYEAARRERRVLDACAHPNVPRALDLLLRDVDPCLVLECVPGTTVWSWIGSAGPAPIAAALEIGIGVADALCAVHAARYIHRDVTPRNVIFDRAASRAYLIDFGLAIPIGTDQAGEFSGTWLYVAPEQTGRMNRPCGFQTDLYTLGATLFHVLVGEPPFPYEDPLQLIHAHLARAPRAPVELRPEIPEPLSRVVQKLLAKEPAERYASALSLLVDLRELRDQLRDRGHIEPDFELEMQEIPNSPRIPARLYGRAHDSAALADALAQAVTGGPRIAWISGPSGIGVSALVDTLRTPVAERGGYFAAGTATVGHLQAYASWIACIDSLVQQLLVEDDARLAKWREAMGSALGGVSDALCELVPDLRIILSEARPARVLGVSEARARVLLAVQRLLAAAGTREHPLVLFFDELHLADSGSLFLLEELFAAEVSGAYLIVIAERLGDGGEPDLALARVRQRLESLAVPIHDIALAPLDEAALSLLLQDALGRSAEDVAPLVAQIARKTGGNPLCVRQLLEHMAQQRLLTFEPHTGWIWEIAAIASAGVPDGASALLALKLETLEPELRDLLARASCAGASFAPTLLARLLNQDDAVVQRQLHVLEGLGLVVACPQGFRFAHDRIRDAAETSLSNAERRDVHAHIAAAALEDLSETASNETILDLASHLVRAEDSWPRDRSWRRIEVCLTAGRRALRSGALHEARAYLEFACTCLASEDAESRRELALNVYLSCAESAFLERDAARALELLNLAQPYVASNLEHARLEMQRIQSLALVGSAYECVSHALGILRRWRIRWPTHPSYWRVYWAMLRVRRLAVERARMGIAAPGGTLDEARSAALMILNAAGGAMSRVNCRLAALATCYVLRCPLPTALTTREAYSVGNYALWCQIVLGRPKLALELAAQAEAWIRGAGDSFFAERLAITRNGSLNPCVMSRHRAIAPLEAAVDLALENGDVEFAYYARFLRAFYAALGGVRVPICSAEWTDLVALVERARYHLPEPRRCAQAYRWLVDESLDLRDLATAVPGSHKQDSGSRRSPDVWSTTLWTLVLCVFGRWEDLWRLSQQLGVELYRQAPYAHVADHLLYRGIAAAALATKRTDARKYRRALADAARQVARWAKMGPDFGHMEMLLRAELTRLAGQFAGAARLYEQAARRAVAQQFPHHAAIALERRAAMLSEHRRDVEAARVTADALALYASWGASPKVALLRTMRPS
jgi:predicted ATPase